MAEITETKMPITKTIMPSAKPAKPPNNKPITPWVMAPSTINPRNVKIATAMELKIPDRSPAIEPPNMPPATKPATIPPKKPPSRYPTPGNMMLKVTVTKKPTKTPNPTLLLTIAPSLCLLKKKGKNKDSSIGPLSGLLVQATSIANPQIPEGFWSGYTHRQVL